VIEEVIFLIGSIAILLGAVYDLIAAIGILRFPDFYMRTHAATIGTIGGAALPVFGAGLVALVYHPLGSQRFFMAGIAFTVGVLILIIAPTGSHSIISAVYFGRIGKKPGLKVDQLEEDLPKRSDVAELVREHEETPGEEEEPKFTFRRLGR